jgi:hypothetical protein
VDRDDEAITAPLGATTKKVPPAISPTTGLKAGSLKVISAYCPPVPEKVPRSVWPDRRATGGGLGPTGRLAVAGGTKSIDIVSLATACVCCIRTVYVPVCGNGPRLRGFISGEVNVVTIVPSGAVTVVVIAGRVVFVGT